VVAAAVRRRTGWSWLGNPPTDVGGYGFSAGSRRRLPLLR